MPVPFKTNRSQSRFLFLRIKQCALDIGGLLVFHALARNLLRFPLLNPVDQTGDPVTDHRPFAAQLGNGILQAGAVRVPLLQSNLKCANFRLQLIILI